MMMMMMMMTYVLCNAKMLSHAAPGKHDSIAPSHQFHHVLYTGLTCISVEAALERKMLLCWSVLLSHMYVRFGLCSVVRVHSLCDVTLIEQVVRYRRDLPRDYLKLVNVNVDTLEDRRLKCDWIYNYKIIMAEYTR